MSGERDLFTALSNPELAGTLIADTRPALVVDRSGTQLLWANAAGAAFFAARTLDRLLDIRFSATSPFARRIAGLDEALVAGQDRIERLPLQRGLLPRPTVCKARRIVADGIKAILLTVIDGSSSFAGDPSAAFEALIAPAAGPVAAAASAPADEIAVETGLPDAVAEETIVAEPLTVDDAALEAGMIVEDETVESADATEDVATATEAVDEAPVEVATAEDATAEAASFEQASVEATAAVETVDAAAEIIEEAPAAEAVDASTETVDEASAAEAVDASTETVDEAPAAETVVDEAPAAEYQMPAEPASDIPAFAFPNHGRAVRFVFELDPELTFAFVSGDLAATVGPASSAVNGRGWSDVATLFGLDPSGRILSALERRDTFTGLTVDWPVDDAGLRVPVDLAGMPVFGRGRTFLGYRGFGVLKTGAAFAAPYPSAAVVVVDDAATVAEVEAPVEGDPVAGAPSTETDDVAASEDILAPAIDLAPGETPAVAEVAEIVAAEPEADETEIVATEPEAVDPAVVEPEIVTEPAAVDVAGAEPEIVAEAHEIVTEAAEVVDLPVAGPETVAETVEVVDLPVTEPETVAETVEVVDLPVAEPETVAETVEVVDLPVAEPEIVADAPAVVADEPVPTVSSVLDVVEEAPRPSAEVVPSPIVPRRTAYQTELSDKVQALSKPERDAFDKIAEALADAFGPRLAADPTTQLVHNMTPVVRVPEPPATSIDVALLDKLPVALAILRDGDILRANRAFLDLCGYTDLRSLEADGGFAQVFDSAALTRQAAIPTVRRRDGVEVPVSARLHSIPFDGGIASLLVVQETAATTSRDRLATAEQRVEDLEAILDTATDGVLVLDHKGLVIGANRSAEALFGTERSHMIGLAFVDLLAPESHRSALDYLDGLTRNGLSSVLNDGREVIGRVAAGGLVPLFLTVGRVSNTKFCAVLRDITQWKRAEEELTSAKKAAENASSQKSDFLAKMSHEIRTPLNAIIGFSEVMMEERFGAIGNERYKEYLRDIHVSGTHIMSLVNDLLDLSKIEAGKLELTFEAVGLNDVVRECAALMQPQANRERIIIRTSLSSSLPPVVADSRSLRQIVLNLLSNAVKFNAAGGQVIISTLYEESGEVVLRVRDTGQGMSEGDIVKAMEPFRQLSTSRAGGGTGLGLPLTKALVEANRAAFQIDSTPGQGTMIQITFPSTRVLAE